MIGQDGGTAMSAVAGAALACPDCLGDLRLSDSRAWCSSCDREYGASALGPLDLRLRGRKRVEVELRLGEGYLDEDAWLAHLAGRTTSRAGERVLHPDLVYGNRLTGELLDRLAALRGGEGLVVDAGCGDRRAEALLRETTGLDYLGLDYDGPWADALADLHAIPLKTGSVDLIFSLAVLEHLQYPYRAMEELARVLKPGGYFIGTVAFLEPFHFSSFFHPSPLGTLALLRHAGFDVELIDPHPRWTGLQALINMELLGLHRRRYRRLVEVANHKIDRLRRRRTVDIAPGPTPRHRVERLARVAGGFGFVARMPDTSEVTPRGGSEAVRRS